MSETMQSPSARLQVIPKPTQVAQIVSLQKRPSSEEVSELLDLRQARGSYISASYLRMNNPSMLVALARRLANPERYIKYLVGATARAPYDASWIEKLGIKTSPGIKSPSTLSPIFNWSSIVSGGSLSNSLKFVSIAPRHLDYGLVARNTTISGLFGPMPTPTAPSQRASRTTAFQSLALMPCPARSMSPIRMATSISRKLLPRAA